MPNLNQLNLVFGPTIPSEIDSVDIAFISAPTLKYDSAVALLSAERYVRENYPHLRTYPLETQSTTGSSFLFANYTPTDILGMYPNAFTGFNIQGPITGTEDFGATILHNPIGVQGLYLSKAGSWNPIIKAGCIWRYHIVKREEFNQGTVFDSNGAPLSSQVDTQKSWIARSGLKPGDEVFLIYTVPEHKYGLSNIGTSSTFPSSSSKLKAITEIGSLITPTTIQYRTPFKELLEISIDGIVKYQGTFDNTEDSSFIKSINHKLNQIEIKESLAPNAQIIIKTLSIPNTHIYTGFRELPSNNWFPFDANPEYGHYIGDPSAETIRNSSSCLQEQVTLYCIPSAYAKITYGIVGDNASVALNFVSAFSYGETHFVRHLIGQTQEDIQVRQADGPTNTWGTAVLGRNFYDEAAAYPDDTFSGTIPSMLPLGKIVIAAPASIKSVQTADIRSRGGGVPADYPLHSISTNASGLDYLMGMLDLGIWEGPVISEGGVLTIRLNTSLLNDFTPEEIYQIVEDHMHPGVDFEIIYSEDV